ncbi:hypothetical protein N0V85_006984 [Neurospora sp. IMI 360204]|nr:hypothetical protein N0V85_006984 [Neurospora sp. IMI 360204]
MWRAHVRARHGSNGIPLSEVSELTRETVSEGSRQTTETTVSRSTKSKRSSAYDPEFATILRECGIYPDGDPSLLANLEELRRERDVRPSLAPSVYPDERVQYYMDENANAITELDTERMVARAFLGESPLPKSGNIPWSNLSSMTEHQTIAPQPDLYYGFRLDDIDLLLRKRLSSLIIPSVRDGAPGAPYLVFETKGREGNLEVLKRQATYVAAAAARAQFALESFGLDQPVYDNRVLAHAWTYAGGQGLLTHYGMRVSAPGPGTSREGYHMTLIKRYYVTDSKEQYRAGITAFRNCRDEAYKAAQARLDTAHERLRRMLSSQEETCVPTGALAPLPEARYKDVDDGYLAASLAPEILNHVVGGNTDSLSDSARLLQEQLPPLPEAQYKDIDDGYLAASLAPEIPNDLDGDDTDGFSDSRLLQEQLKEEYEAWLARESLTP